MYSSPFELKTEQFSSQTFLRTLQKASIDARNLLASSFESNPACFQIAWPRSLANPGFSSKNSKRHRVGHGIGSGHGKYLIAVRMALN